MQKRVLWVDDECLRYREVVDRLRLNKVKTDLAYSASEGIKVMESDTLYDAIVIDIILPYGFEYKEEDVDDDDERLLPYLGLKLLSEAFALRKGVPIIVLTIATDPRVHAKLNEWREMRLVCDVLDKGALRLDDVVEVILRAING